MTAMFRGAQSFNGDITKWDVSSVDSMNSLFFAATSFNRDISRWDVSSVTHMDSMFRKARPFNSDISKWDVSRVNTMSHMFYGAVSFKQKLCGAAWVHSKANKRSMFEGSSGSISPTVCTITSTFLPQTKAELKNAIDACVHQSLRT